LFDLRYHNGWLSLQRRQINPRNNQAEQAANQQNNEANQDGTPNETAQQPNNTDTNTGPNLLRLCATFVLNFFTSLIPERPRIPN
jgi:hypothetical protein